MTREEWKLEQLVLLLLAEGLEELNEEGRKLFLQKIEALSPLQETRKEAEYVV